jgi:exonuclease III
MPNKNGLFKNNLMLIIGTYLRICHLNIEGISKIKCEILSKIMISNNVDVIALQETHTTDEADLQKLKYIAGYTLIGAINYKQYGIVSYTKNYIERV